jgi:hypothetical protein
VSQLVKTKRQANFKGFKRFGAFKGLVEQKNVVFNSFVCKLGLFWHAWAILKRVKRANLYPVSQAVHCIAVEAEGVSRLSSDGLRITEKNWLTFFVTAALDLKLVY